MTVESIATSTNALAIGRRPWMALGEEVSGAMTADEAITRGKLDWTVETRQAYYPNGEPVPAFEGDPNPQPMLYPVPQQFHLCRTDRHHDNVLGYVKGRYHPLQNREAFDFFDSIVAANEAYFEVAGSLNQGARVWVLAKLPQTIEIVKGDVIDQYLLLTNGHDGKSAVSVKFTPIRATSGATLLTSLRGGAYKVKHSRLVVDKLKEATAVMGLANTYYDQLAESLKFLSATPFNASEIDDYIEAVVGDSVKKAELLRELLEAGKGQDLKGIRGTALGAYYALTEFIDHYTEYKNADTRLDNVWFKTGSKTKAKAFAAALDFAKKKAKQID
jgi:phage/plasmid-like protein (TIGR03299 family)